MDFLIKFLLKNPRIKEVFKGAYHSWFSESDDYIFVKKKGFFQVYDEKLILLLDSLKGESPKILNNYLITSFENSKLRTIRSLKTGKKLFTPKYSTFKKIERGFFLTKKFNPLRIGIIDSLGNEVVPNEFDFVSYHKFPLIILSSRGKNAKQHQVIFDLEIGKISQSENIIHQRFASGAFISNKMGTKEYSLILDSTFSDTFNFNRYEIFADQFLALHSNLGVQIHKIEDNGLKFLYEGSNIYQTGSENFFYKYEDNERIFLNRNFEPVSFPKTGKFSCNQIGCTTTDTLGVSYILDNSGRLKKVNGEFYEATQNSFIFRKGEKYYVHSLKNKVVELYKEITFLLRGIDFPSVLVGMDENENTKLLLAGKEFSFDRKIKVKSYDDGIIVFEENGKLGLIDIQNKNNIVDPKFEEIKEENGLYKLFPIKDLHFGFFHKRIGLYEKPEFTTLSSPKEGFLKVSRPFSNVILKY